MKTRVSAAIARELVGSDWAIDTAMNTVPGENLSPTFPRHAPYQISISIVAGMAEFLSTLAFGRRFRRLQR